MLFRLVIIFMIFELGACVNKPKISSQKWLNLAINTGFEQRIIKTTNFSLLTLHKNSGSKILRVYIEGDGHAFNRYNISNDPTPNNPLALKLTLQDNSTDSLLYIARPGQYVMKMGYDKNCSPDYWTTKRFAPEVVDDTAKIIDAFKNRFNYEKIELVGFSGGGGIAAILAAKRNDVINLRTVAGNLNTDYFTKYHKVLPMTGSINPQDGVAEMQHIPQIHFVGEKDKIIPKTIATAFSKNNVCSKVVEIPDSNHLVGWENIWNQLLLEKFTCN